jgi:hypothetical protein
MLCPVRRACVGDPRFDASHSGAVEYLSQTDMCIAVLLLRIVRKRPDESFVNAGFIKCTFGQTWERIGVRVWCRRLNKIRTRRWRSSLRRA